MTFFKDIFNAILYCFKGFEVLFEKGLWPYIFYPIIVWLLMWVGSIWVFAKIAITVAAYINHQLNFNTIPDSGSLFSFAKPLLTGYFTIIISWVIKILLWFVTGTFVKYVTLILLSPLFSLLSEATEEKLTGNIYPFNTFQFLKDVFRGITISLRNMLIEYFFIAVCFILNLVFPPLIVITTPFLIIISWYYIGFTMLDYNFERHKMSISDSSHFTKKHIGTACGIGIIYSFFMILPLFIGLMFGPVLAVIGATLSFINIKKQAITTNEII